MSTVETITTPEIDAVMKEIRSASWSQGAVNSELGDSEAFVSCLLYMMERFGLGMPQIVDVSPYVALGIEIGAAIERQRRENFLSRFETEELQRMFSLGANGNSQV